MSNRSQRGPEPGSRGASRSGNPARRHAQPAAPTAPPARRTLERLSAPVLVTLHALPRWLVPVLLATALFVGLILSGSWAWLGAVLLVVIAVFLSWLTALSWPILTPASRGIRVVVSASLFGIAVLKAMGRF